MKNLKYFVKKNYHILLLILMFVSILYVVFHSKFWGDDYRYYRVALCEWKEIFRFLKWHLQNYNGRTLVHFLVVLSLKNQFAVNIWRICSAAAGCLICILIAKITSENKTDFRIGCTVSILIIMGTIPNFWKMTIYWQTGWFNYIFPSLLLLLLVLLCKKKPKSVWIFPLSFICGVTTEQFGLMTVGLFVLLGAEYIYKKRSFNPRIFAELIFASAGYATVVLSPGTYSRVSYQGTLKLNKVVVNLITILRKRWIDNICIFILIFVINLCIVYWLIKLKNKNRFTAKVNIPLSIAVSAGTICNYGLKAAVFLLKMSGKQIGFSDTLNKCIFVLWLIYAFLFIASFFYTTWFIYIYKGDVFPFISFILGAGSQLMMVVAELSMQRTCTAGFFMFMIFTTYSANSFAADIRQSNHKKVKKYFKIEAINAAVCVCACIVQAVVGLNVLFPDTDHISRDQFPIIKMDSEKMKEFTRYLEIEEQQICSSEVWIENFDITDFTWLY